MLQLGDSDTEMITIVRETLNEDNEPVTDPFATRGIPLECKITPRLPQPDQYTTGERTISTLDVWCPDRDADVLATDRARRADEPTDKRPRWTVEGEPARSPFPAGGCVFVLQREAG